MSFGLGLCQLETRAHAIRPPLPVGNFRAELFDGERQQFLVDLKTEVNLSARRRNSPSMC
jgi:hypothetical protein